jgi:hypothetical protein
MKENILGEECGTHGKKFVRDIVGESLKKIQHPKDLGIN